MVLLVRHASREPRWGEHEEEHPIRASERLLVDPVSSFGAEAAGAPLTYGLAGRLCDQLAEEGIETVEIHHSAHRAAAQTAAIFEAVLRKRGFRTGERREHRGLTPRPAPDEKAAREALLAVTGTLFGEEAPGAAERRATACLLVGHQPQLSRIAREVVGRRLPAGSLPLGGSEIACVQIQDGRRLRWLITAKPAALLGELKAKIQSKYDVAKFFLGALVVGTGLTLNKDLWETPHPADKVLVGVGAFAALLSLGLTAATLFAYDRLVMPSAFWLGSSGAEEPPRWSVRRPPSQEHVVLFYEMVHVWSHLFMPALLLAFAAVALFVVALAHRGSTVLPAGWWLPAPLWGLLLGVFLLLAAVALGIPALLYYRWKPRLGVDD